MRWNKSIALLLFALLFSTFSSAQAQDTLVVGYSLSPPFVKQVNGKLEGPSVWLWEHVREDLDLPCTYVQLSLDSLLRGLGDGSVDLSMSPLTITSERAKAFDFSSPYFIAYSTVLTRSHSTLRRIILFLFSLFSLNFFRALGALAMVIMVFGLLVWLFERKANREEFGPGLRGLWQGFWWSAVTMTTVGYGDKSPKTIGGRIVALVWMFTAIIIISGFTASIASSLMVNELYGAQNRINDFKEQRLGTIKGSGTEKWLVDNFFNDRATFETMPPMVDALKKGEIDAIAYDMPQLQDLMRTDTLRNYEILPIAYNPQFYAMGFSKRLPETMEKQISTAILELTEGYDWQVVLSEYDLKWEN